ncbi:efflux RND transporter periplasmic adaptor subunit [Mycobacterium sp. KBS0706]|uniref:efflux RND transporter periplasmic adaptor subunit n=1 Tax=Mycobacterium sp. KBS0706 TaxID=2578109 RepID=UPI00110F94CD|nr:efflux RND transporter periplasmic adaptor subunit [Mycobacterium sp. KBS0706]TSD84434.1 efflux RND transporter periplasmic adaptor subunit [Mycobacterium sp. KBS0706]
MSESWTAWRRRPPVAALGVLLFLAACNESSDKQAQAPQMPPPAVGVVTAAKKPVTEGYTFVGRVQAVNNVNLVARVEGFLQQRNYTEGQEVKAGDLLFVLEKDTYQAAVDQAQANLTSAQANAANAKVQADRARDLIKNQNVSQAVLDDREAAEKTTIATVQQTQAALEEAQINLGYTSIQAPFDGRVGISNFSVGALVGPSSGALATIVSQDPIYVLFPVSDRFILDVQQATGTGKVAPQDVAVKLTLANGSQYPQVGKIDFTDVKVDQNTDTLMVRAEFANPQRTLTDGQYARVTAERKDPVDALVIPQRAILTDQSGNYVLVVGEGNKVAAKHVTTGANQGADVVVQQGLNDGDVVIVDGVQKVRPGQEVNPAPTSEPSGPAGGGAAPAGNSGSGQAAPAKPAGN